MLMVPDNESTRPFTAADAQALKGCDEVTTYREAGWFCVAGWKGDRRVVHAHCSSQEQYERAMGLRTDSGWDGGSRGYR